MSSDGGGAGGAGVEGCVCMSSRAAAEDERKRRGVPLAVGSCRTHRRQTLKCRTDGVTDAIGTEGGVADVSGGWLRSCFQNVRPPRPNRKPPRVTSTPRTSEPPRPAWLPREYLRRLEASHTN